MSKECSKKALKIRIFHRSIDTRFTEGEPVRIFALLRAKVALVVCAMENLLSSSKSQKTLSVWQRLHVFAIKNHLACPRSVTGGS